MHLIYGTIASICDAQRFVAHEESQALSNVPMTLLHSQSFITEFDLSPTLNTATHLRDVQKANALFDFYQYTAVLHCVSFGYRTDSIRVRIAALADTIATQWHDYAESIYDANLGGRLITHKADQAAFLVKVQAYWNIAALLCTISFNCLLPTSIENAALRKLFVLLSKLDAFLVEQADDLQSLQKITISTTNELESLSVSPIALKGPMTLGNLESRIWETHHGTYSDEHKRKKDWKLMQSLLKQKWSEITDSKQMADDLAKGIVAVSRKHDELLTQGSVTLLSKLKFVLFFWVTMSRVYASLHRLKSANDTQVK